MADKDKEEEMEWLAEALQFRAVDTIRCQGEKGRRLFSRRLFNLLTENCFLTFLTWLAGKWGHMYNI